MKFAAAGVCADRGGGQRAESYALGYDAVGNVASRRVSYGLGNERVYRTAYDLRGHNALEFYYE